MTPDDQAALDLLRVAKPILELNFRRHMEREKHRLAVARPTLASDFERIVEAPVAGISARQMAELLRAETTEPTPLRVLELAQGVLTRNCLRHVREHRSLRRRAPYLHTAAHAFEAVEPDALAVMDLVEARGEGG